MKVVIDTREQCPLDFSKYDCEVMRGTLATGDYSLAGLENLVTLERKSLDDLVQSLQGEARSRFERELQRGKGLHLFGVIIEGSMKDVAEHRYKSRRQPHAVLQSILAFQVRHHVPFIWAGCRRGAAYVTYWLLQKYQRQVMEVAA